MTAESVISCPHCLRQYAVDAAWSGRVGQCGVCKAHFTVVVSEPTSAHDGAAVFENELVPRYNFIADGCAVMARNVCELLTLAKLPITIDAVREIVRTIPRFGSGNDDRRGQHCVKTLDLAHQVTLDTPDQPRCRELVEYFLHYIPTRHLDSADMLKGAFAGVLGALEFDAPKVETPKRSGPLERWARKMGL